MSKTFSAIRSASTLWLVSLVAVAFAGCGGADTGRAPIVGEVTMGGQPLAKGHILFIPVAPNEGPTASAAIVNGKYEIDGKNGPVVGPNRVEVAADLGVALDDKVAVAKLGGRLPPQPIPPQFNVQSTLVYEVLEGQPNQYDIAVPSGRQHVARPTY